MYRYIMFNPVFCLGNRISAVYAHILSTFQTQEIQKGEFNLKDHFGIQTRTNGAYCTVC